MTTDKRKAQYREASKNNRKAKQAAGWKRIWIPPGLVGKVKGMIKQLKEAAAANGCN